MTSTADTAVPTLMATAEISLAKAIDRKFPEGTVGVATLVEPNFRVAADD